MRGMEKHEVGLETFGKGLTRGIGYKEKMCMRECGDHAGTSDKRFVVVVFLIRE